MRLQGYFWKLKPAASRTWLLGLAGLTWSVVGVVLCRFAFRWLLPVARMRAVPLGALGIALALVVYRFGFSRIAARNIDRVSALSERPCLFAFQAWRSYLIIVVMVALGITLRHSAFPKPFLAVIYAAVGGAMLLSSFLYYARLWRLRAT